MKNSANEELLGTVALIVSGIVGGLGALGAKVALTQLPPLTILFLRITIIIVLLLPFIAKHYRELLKHRRSIVILGLLWVGNLTLFIIGIQYATAVASGIIYAGSPIVVLIEEYLLNRTKVTSAQAVGLAFGFVGAVAIILDSYAGGIGIGSLLGVIILFLAKICFSTYIVYSKRASTHVSPLKITVGSAIVGWIVSGLFMFFIEGGKGLVKLPYISSNVWQALLYLGIIHGFLLYFLVQWGLKRASSLVAASMIYITTVISAATGIVFLGETLTVTIFLSGVSVLIGVYLISILPILRSRRSEVVIQSDL